MRASDIKASIKIIGIFLGLAVLAPNRFAWGQSCDIEISSTAKADLQFLRTAHMDSYPYAVLAGFAEYQLDSYLLAVVDGYQDAGLNFDKAHRNESFRQSEEMGNLLNTYSSLTLVKNTADQCSLLRDDCRMSSLATSKKDKGQLSTARQKIMPCLKEEEILIEQTVSEYRRLESKLGRTRLRNTLSLINNLARKNKARMLPRLYQAQVKLSHNGLLLAKKIYHENKRRCLLNLSLLPVTSYLIEDRKEIINFSLKALERPSMPCEVIGSYLVLEKTVYFYQGKVAPLLWKRIGQAFVRLAGDRQTGPFLALRAACSLYVMGGKFRQKGEQYLDRLLPGKKVSQLLIRNANGERNLAAFLNLCAQDSPVNSKNCKEQLNILKRMDTERQIRNAKF